MMRHVSILLPVHGFHLAEERFVKAWRRCSRNSFMVFKNFLAPTITEESCTIVGLYDVGKLGMPAKSLYLPNDNEWMIKTSGIKYKINPDVVAMGLSNSQSLPL